MDNTNVSQAKKPEYSLFDSTFAWFCFVMGYLFCRAFPPGDYPLGMFLVALFTVSATVFALLYKKACVNKFAFVFALISLVFAFSPIVSSNSDIRPISFLLSVACYSYFVYSASGKKLEKGFSDFVIIEFLIAVFAFPLTAFGKVFPAMFSGKKRTFSRVFKIIGGLFLGLIPTAVVAMLLAYDEGFSEIITTIIAYFDDFNVFSHLISLWFGCIVSMYIYGLYGASTEETDHKITVDSCRKKTQKLGVVPVLTAAAALLPLIAVYVIFFVSQIDYYVSAFSGVLPEGISYSNYARDGFFELCKVSGINFFLLIAISTFTYGGGEFSKAFHKTASVLLSVVSLVLIATAMSKMALYIGRYGLTVKRVLSSWFMILLAIIFLMVIIKQFVPRFKLIASSSVAFVCMLLILSLSNFTGIIADYNVNRYVSNKTDGIDVHALCDYDNSSVPAAVKLAKYWESVGDTENNYNYDYVINYLNGIKWKSERDNGFFEFSIPNHRARQEIKEYLG